MTRNYTKTDIHSRYLSEKTLATRCFLFPTCGGGSRSWPCCLAPQLHRSCRTPGCFPGPGASNCGRSKRPKSNGENMIQTKRASFGNKMTTIIYYYPILSMCSNKELDTHQIIMFFKRNGSFWPVELIKMLDGTRSSRCQTASFESASAFTFKGANLPES